MIEPADHLIRRKLEEELEVHSDYAAVENVVRYLHVTVQSVVRILYDLVVETEKRNIADTEKE